MEAVPCPRDGGGYPAGDFWASWRLLSEVGDFMGTLTTAPAITRRSKEASNEDHPVQPARTAAATAQTKSQGHRHDVVPWLNHQRSGVAAGPRGGNGGGNGGGDPGGALDVR